jgi:hypothetical protein
VTDTQKQGAGVIVHIGRVENGILSVGETITARVDAARRRATVLNHSATHLLHAALRTVLGGHVQQKGSLVEPERLRFDFTHYEPVTPEQLDAIENLVNEQIRLNAAAETRLMSIDEARWLRRHGPVRGEVRRAGARPVPRGFLGGIVRWHPCQAGRRHRPAQDRVGGRHRGRRAPHRGGHGCGRLALGQ